MLPGSNKPKYNIWPLNNLSSIRKNIAISPTMSNSSLRMISLMSVKGCNSANKHGKNGPVVPKIILHNTSIRKLILPFSLKTTGQCDQKLLLCFWAQNNKKRDLHYYNDWWIHISIFLWTWMNWILTFKCQDLILNLLTILNKAFNLFYMPPNNLWNGSFVYFFSLSFLFVK